MKISTITKTIALGVVLTQPMLVSAASQVYQTGYNDAWGMNGNDIAMDTAFGAGSWIKSYGFDMNGVGEDTTFLFLDGSDTNTNQLVSFIGTHQTELQNFVIGGGHLFINAAPNEGESFNFGFGDASLNYIFLSSNASATNEGLATGIFDGLASVYTGNYFSHATVLGTDLTSYIDGEYGSVFAGMQYGAGFVAFGGMTDPFWSQPTDDALQLRANMLSMVAYHDTSPVPVPAAVWLFSSGMISLFVAASRRKLV